MAKEPDWQFYITKLVVWINEDKWVIYNAI